MNLYNFKDIVGNTTTISLVKKSLNANAFANFTIFHGDEGCGKSTTAGICALRLTCSNPKEGEPCLECDNCKLNLKVLKSNGASSNLVVKNLGKLNTKADLDKIITEVFVLENPIGNSVYLFEEFHALSEGLQTALLEEIDRLDENVYIIITTTKLTNILKEIKSRAILFNFKRLNDKEMSFLYDRQLELLSRSNNIQKLQDPDISEIIIRKSRGIPRDLLNLSKFLIETNPTMEEIREYLGYIDSDTVFRIVVAMKSDFSLAVKELNFLLENYSVWDLFTVTKESFLSLFYNIEANIPLSTEVPLEFLKSVFTSKKVYKFCSYLDNYRGNVTKLDIKFIYFKLYMIINDKNEKDILKDNAKEALKDSELAKQNRKELEEIKTNKQADSLIINNDLMSYFNK